MDLFISYIKGPLKESFREQHITLTGQNVISFGHRDDVRFTLPEKGGVKSRHAVIKRKRVADLEHYTLQPREGTLAYRLPGQRRFSNLASKEDFVILNHGLQFKIGPHLFEVVDRDVAPPPRVSFWEKPMQRRRILQGAAVATGLGAASYAASKLEPVQQFFQVLRNLPSILRRRDLASRISLGVYPHYAWRQRHDKPVHKEEKKAIVHFVPHQAVQQLTDDTGVKFKDNVVYIRLNQAAQGRWRFEHHGEHFFSKSEYDALAAMMRAGVMPRFALEPLDGLHTVPLLRETITALARDLNTFGPTTIRFAPSLNSPRSPYRWNKLGASDSENLRRVGEAFAEVAQHFKTYAPTIKLTFSPLLPYDPSNFEHQAHEISRLLAVVKPYVHGASGVFYPNSIESVKGIEHYVDVLNRHGVRFLGLDEFAARGIKPFQESLRRFADPRVSKDWIFLNFADVHSTDVEPGSQFQPWHLTQEKKEIIQTNLQSP